MDTTKNYNPKYKRRETVIELIFHSYFRWLIVISLIITIAYISYGYIKYQPFTQLHKNITLVSINLLHLQWVLGLYIYFNSEMIHSFFDFPKQWMKIDEIRFYAIEHSITMLLAICLATYGYHLSKKVPSSHLKFRKLILYMSLSFLLIIIAIPWEFSPYVQRPLFR